jgi:DNA polymerase-1
MPRRALIIHATDLLTRGFQTVSTDRATDAGEPVNAVYAVAGALDRALSFKRPDVAVAVIDAAVDPAKLPAKLRGQVARLAELISAHGFVAVESERAVDLVASYVRAALDDGCDVVIAGSDKRLAQLVGDDVWWYDAYKDVRYTPELVRKRFEVGPASVAEWLALVGDNDNLPGVKGIGKKGATALIVEHGSVTAAVAEAESIKGRTGKALRAALDDVDRELARARLDTGLELPVPIADLEVGEPPEGALQKLFVELGFVELLVSKAESPVDVEVCDTADKVAAGLEGFEAGGAIALMALTEDPSPVCGELAGLAIGQAGRILYVPFAGDGRVVGGPEVLADFLADPRRRFIGHDVKSAVVALARRGVELGGIIGDSACASHLTEPSNWASHDLEIVARQVLHRALPELDSVRGVGRRRKDWSEIAVERAAGYAARLVDAAEKCWEALSPDIDPDLLAEYLALSDTLTRMELRGIAVDGDDLERAGEDFERISGELEAEIFEIAGRELNLGSTKQLGQVLFEDLGLPVVKRTKTGWSTATEALERIEHAHPIVSRVIRWRRLRRLVDSWVNALGAAIDADGRVRSTFHPARSFSGRLVNSNPDLGRVPGRTPEMQRIRHAFAAPEGTALLSVDYRQLGLYVLAHLTGDPALVEPLAADRDMHALTAAAVLELDLDQIDADQRQLGKLINFATFAGQGASALALQLGVDVKEAKEFIARFDDHYSVVREFQDEQLRLAGERGWVETLAGRRWPIGGLRSPDHMERSYAARLARRATHEGSVADVSRRGLLRADQAIRAAGLSGAPLLQVHDEVLFEVPEKELAETAEVAAEAMRTAFDLRVPLRVGCKAGPNWADLEPIG